MCAYEYDGLDKDYNTKSEVAVFVYILQTCENKPEQLWGIVRQS